MNATPVATFVKKSVGWSIGLSVLMIVAGILAIASPLAAGIAVNLLVAWLLVFSGCADLVFAWYTRGTAGFLWELLVGILYIFIGIYLLMYPAAGLASLTIALAIYLSILEGGSGVCLGIQTSPASGIQLARIRWDRHPYPRHHDLEDVAVEHGMGHRHTGGDQHAF